MRSAETEKNLLSGKPFAIKYSEALFWLREPNKDKLLIGSNGMLATYLSSFLKQGSLSNRLQRLIGDCLELILNWGSLSNSRQRGLGDLVQLLFSFKALFRLRFR